MNTALTHQDTIARLCDLIAELEKECDRQRRLRYRFGSMNIRQLLSPISEHEMLDAIDRVKGVSKDGKVSFDRRSGGCR